jgi:hypothetical protein
MASAKLDAQGFRTDGVHSDPDSHRAARPRRSEDDDELPLMADEHGPQSIQMTELSRGHPKDKTADGQDEEEEDGEAEGQGFLGGGRRVSRSSSVQSFELYTPEEGKRVLRKLDRRVVVFMALLYMLSFLDRSSKALCI